MTNIATVLFACGLACNRQTQAPPAPQDAHAASTSEAKPAIDTPEGVIKAINRDRREGRLGSLRDYVHPDQADAVMELIMTVDQVGYSLAALKQAVTETIGDASSELFDFSEFENLLQVFARDVTVIDVAQSDDEATVVIQIGRRMPLSEVRLLQIDGHWIVMTDPPVQGLPAALSHFAGDVDRVTRQLRQHRWDVSELRKELARGTSASLEEIRRLRSAAP